MSSSFVLILYSEFVTFKNYSICSNSNGSLSHESKVSTSFWFLDEFSKCWAERRFIFSSASRNSFFKLNSSASWAKCHSLSSWMSSASWSSSLFCWITFRTKMMIVFLKHNNFLNVDQALLINWNKFIF